MAAEVSAADWHLAAVAAKAAMATAEGTASHIAPSPAVLGEIEAARDELGHQLYPDAATSFAGLTNVSAVGASQPVVYDQAMCSLVIRRDFSAEFSRQAASAWDHYAISVRVVGRFAMAVPQPSKAARKLKVGAAQASGGRKDA